MSVPEQVRKQSEKIAQLHKDVYGDSEAIPSNDDVAEINPSELESNVDKDVKVSSPTGDGDDFEQKWRTLQGMYEKSNADCSQLRADNQNLNSRLQSTETLLGNLNVAQNSPAPAVSPPVSFVTDKDVEDYGEDAISMMRRVSQDEVTSFDEQIKKLSDSVERLQTEGNVTSHNIQHVAKQQDEDSSQRFWEDLNTLAPDWQTINSDPEFVKWLQSEDKLSGVTLQSYLTDAEKKLDSRRVAGFFDMWNNMSGTPSDTSKTSPTELETLVAPSRGSVEPVVSKDIKKTISRAQIEKFYIDMRSGKYKGRDDESKRIEAAIFEASAKNLITN